MTISAEEYLQRLGGDMVNVAKRLSILESHHQTTINLMKILADRMGLELWQRQEGDGVRIGWRQKVVVAAPGMLPGGKGQIQFPGRG